MKKTILYKGKELSYQASGDGPTVVLLHGFGEDGTVWQEQISFLEKDFKVVVPHLPGSGSSEMIEDMSMEGLAEAIVSVFEVEEIKQASLIGHSMGGYITLAFAEKHPSLLNSFGLFHSSAYADSEEKKATRRKGIETIKEKGAYEFLKTMVTNLYCSYTKEHQPEIIQDHIKAVDYFSPQAVIAYYEGMMNRPDRVSVLQQNKVPVLFVLGRYDTAVPIEQGLKQVALPDISYIHVLEHSGHMGMREEPKLSNELLKSFLLKTV